MVPFVFDKSQFLTKQWYHFSFFHQDWSNRAHCHSNASDSFFNLIHAVFAITKDDSLARQRFNAENRNRYKIDALLRGLSRQRYIVHAIWQPPDAMNAGFWWMNFQRNFPGCI